MGMAFDMDIIKDMDIHTVKTIMVNILTTDMAIPMKDMDIMILNFTQPKKG